MVESKRDENDNNSGAVPEEPIQSVNNSANEQEREKKQNYL